MIFYVDETDQLIYTVWQERVFCVWRE